MTIGSSIIGVGMGRFGKHLDLSLLDLAAPVVRESLEDAKVPPDQIDVVFVACAMSSVMTGQVNVNGQCITQRLGLHGIPVFNVENACASGSSAFNLADTFLKSGRARTALVLGVEKMFGRDKAATYQALNGAADQEYVRAAAIDVTQQSVFVTHVYPERLERYAETYGLNPEDLAQIAVKNRANAAKNGKAQFRDPMTVETVLSSRVVASPITALMCAPFSDGACAVVLSNDKSLVTRAPAPVHLLASRVGSGPASHEQSLVSALAHRAYADAGVRPRDISLAEVHDSTSFTELLAYEELGLCAPGEASRAVRERYFHLDGRCPVNTSGGLQSRGHAIGATGLSQIYELVTQLRGKAGARQVMGARIALAENAGGFAHRSTAAAAITILEG